MDITTVKRLTHYFEVQGKPFLVLEDLSLMAKSGDVISILGPSGCGKSTLLRCIAGLINPSMGEILINGVSPKEAIKQKSVGFAFQEPMLLKWKKVKENIMLPAIIGNGTKLDSKTSDEKLARLLNLVGLADFKDFYPDQLSGGMKQRVSLARTLFISPRLLLLDEPFGSLDLLTRTKLMIELSNIIYNVSVPTIIVTHSIEEAVFLASKVYIISSLPGRVVEEINVGFSSPRKQSLLGDNEFSKTVAYCRSMLLRFWDNHG